jgi:hypothetical protein
MSDLEGWSKHIENAEGAGEESSGSKEKRKERSRQSALKVYRKKKQPPK